MDPIATTFVSLGATALVAGLFFAWQSLRAAFGVVDIGTAEDADATRTGLLERKDALLETLQDLRFEHEAGKIDADDFAAMDAKVRAEAKGVLAALDDDLEPYRADAERMIDAFERAGGFDSQSGQIPLRRPERGTGGVRAGRTARERRRRRDAASESGSIENAILCPQCMAPNPPDSRICGECRARVAPVTCGACGAENDADATFCKKCGAAIAETGPEGLL